jgi:hypothetical protein
VFLPHNKIKFSLKSRFGLAYFKENRREASRIVGVCRTRGVLHILLQGDGRESGLESVTSRSGKGGNFPRD